MNIFVSSIENGGGKTLISAGICAVMQSFGYKTGIYKPVQTGAIDKGKYLVSPDLALVKTVDNHIKTHSTYMFKTHAVPVIGSIIENIDINLENIENDYKRLAAQTDILLVEAAGGLMTPLKKNMFSYHLAQKLNLPVLFIITPSESLINCYFSEINTAKMLGLNIAGTIINKFPAYSVNTAIRTFPEIIEEYGNARILGLIRKFRGKSISANALINEILNGTELENILRMKISKLNGF